MILTVTANPAIDRVYFVDEFIMGEVWRPKSLTYTAGGKGLNVSRVAKTLDQEVTAMGFVGGFNGQYIKEEIKKLGITPCFTDISGETRICINITDKSGKSGEILESGPEVSVSEAEAFIETFKSEVKKSDVVTISGSLPKGLTPDFYVRLVDIAKENGKPVIVDTSGESLKAVISAKPFMVKPNKFELSKHMGCEITTEKQLSEALMLLYNSGVEIPVVSLGKEGAMAVIDGRCVKFYTPDVTVVNSVGSGDSFIGGVATGICMGKDKKECIRLGMACGTANTQFSKTGTVSKELVNKFILKIEMEEI